MTLTPPHHAGPPLGTPEAPPAGRTGPRPPATPPTVPGPRTRAAAPRRTTPGCSADGRRWDLLTDRTSVTAVTPQGTVAEAHVSERDEQVVVEFWADGPGLPAELSDQLVTQAFSLPLVRLHRPVVVCVPRHDGAVLAEARRHVEGAWTRMAGVTCLLEGRVGERPSAPSGCDSDWAPR